jgi:hypothetical protein
MLRDRDEMTQQIMRVIENVESLDKDYRRDLQVTLEGLAHRAKALAGMVKTGKPISRKETQKLLNG